MKAAEDAVTQLGLVPGGELTQAQGEAWLTQFQENLKPYIESFVSRRLAPRPKGDG